MPNARARIIYQSDRVTLYLSDCRDALDKIESASCGLLCTDPPYGGGALSARMRQGTVLRIRRPNGSATGRHATEKPVALMLQLIESSSVRGSLVIDPFAGSGSTLVAAVLLGRRAIGVEINHVYAKRAVARIKAAEHIADLADAA